MKKGLIYTLLLLIASCGIKKDDETGYVGGSDGSTGATMMNPTLPEGEEIVFERPSYQPSETILTDLIHTKLEVNFNWKESQMNGVATITAKPHFHTSNELILDAKSMQINSVKMNDKALEYSYLEDMLYIELDKEYTRDEKYTVVIDYIAKPEERKEGGSDAITSDKGLFFINPLGEEEGKMPQIWTQGETEASSVWFPTIDSPNAKTTQEIFIKVQDKFVTLSNGELVSSKKVDDGMRIDHWKQDLPHTPYLFMMGVGEFKIVKDKYTRPDGTEMEVNYYVEPEWEQYAKGIFGETPAMIKFFSELLGVEYPWDKYHQIVVRDYVSGAMENTGAVIFGDYVYRNDRELLDGNDQSTIAHELFHHWFGDLVTCESWSNLTLNESFANYSQYLWDEHRYGIDEADYYAEIEGEGYMQSAGMQGYHDLVWFDYEDKEQMFDGHSYNKGGRILHMLRNYIGDDAFFTALNKYLTDNKFKAAEFHHLRLAFEEVSGEDLNWFFNQWYLGSGHPNLQFTQEIDETNKKLNIKVAQTQSLDLAPIYKIPFQIAVFDDAGMHLHDVVIDQLDEEFQFGYTGELKTFVYDYQQMVLSTKEIDKDEKHYINQYYLGERYMARKEALNGATSIMMGQKLSNDGQKLILDALKDKFWYIRELALGKVDMLEGEYAIKGKESVKGMLQYDPKSDVRVAALSAIKLLEEDQEVLTSLYKGRIEEDRSYSVVSMALAELGGINPEEALAMAEPLENEKSSKMVYGISQLYAAHAGPEKFDFIKNALTGTTVQGFDKLGVLNSLTFFVTRNEVEIAEQSLPLYEEQSKDGGFYMMMFLPQNITYLNGFFTQRVVELKDELAEHEKNKDALYADQTRAKIAQWEAVQKKYQDLNEAIREGSDRGGVHGDDEVDGEER